MRQALPLNLLDALRAFGASRTIEGGFWSEFVRLVPRLKHDEWNSYAGT